MSITPAGTLPDSLLAEAPVGMDTIPGGKVGCIVGTGKNAALLHYNAGGLLIGSARPGAAMIKQSGWYDNQACVAVR